ncbi:hypothetical protein [Streptomyces sp. SID12501]|uniref:hypothetical protein n=1 Tax=Streptomyces sp. SID12501 TaxID=2706042 RepID=UPI001EF3B9B7|nr:hypothetical protein [Streptomyces sp. SID12501]
MLAQWLDVNKPLLFLEGDRMITPESRLLEPRYELPPFDPAKLTALDWIGVDIRKESQRAERRTDSIQFHMSRHLQETDAFDVLIDDDGAGEAADLVGLRIDGNDIIVTLVHCKYSSADRPGARVKDLYELCGQAVRGAKWRHQGLDPLLRHLDQRAQHSMQRTGISPYEVGTIEDLYRIRRLAPQLRPRLRTVLAQPGLSARASTPEHLRLLAGAQSYVHAVARSTFTVYCST